MSCYVGLTESWVDTNSGKSYAVQNNLETNDALVASVDARKSASYPGTGTTWYDTSGNNNHFTLMNSATYANKCFTLNGVNQYIQQDAVGTVGSIGFWANITRTGWITSIAGSFTGSGSWNVINSGYADGVVRSFSSSDNMFNQLQYLNSWHYFHLNLSALQTDPRIKVLGLSSSTVSAGSVAKINVYNRALTSEEIMKNYTSIINRNIIQ